MPDVWATANQLDPATQKRLATVLESRGADLQQQTMRRKFLSTVEFPMHARVLDVGCGTGVLTRMMSRWANVQSVTGIDPAHFLLEHARELASELENVTFQEGDARSLPFDSDVFDVVVFDSTLSHIVDPGRALGEAFRVLREQGRLAVFDGDYATTTVALGENDPLQVCVNAMVENSLTNRWLVRGLAALVRAAGFQPQHFQSHSFVDASGGDYMLSIIDRGAEILAATGASTEETAEALKAEARRRAAAGTFFGHIAYASLTARKQ
jgi:SAM-dependent methyltransferase